MPRITKSEKEDRITKICELLAAGLYRDRILQYASQKQWGVTDRQIDSYIVEAKAVLSENADYDRSYEIGRAIRRLDDIFAACMRVQDYTRALAALRELHSLLALHAEPAAKTLKIHNITPAQLETIATMKEKHDIEPSILFEAMLQELANHE